MYNPSDRLRLTPKAEIQLLQDEIERLKAKVERLSLHIPKTWKFFNRPNCEMCNIRGNWLEILRVINQQDTLFELSLEDQNDIIEKDLSEAVCFCPKCRHVTYRWVEKKGKS